MTEKLLSKMSKEEIDQFCKDVIEEYPKRCGCQCFGCRNKDNPERLYGYYYGQHEMLKSIVTQLKRYGVKATSIADDDLGGLLACCISNLEDCGCLLAEAEEKALNKK